METIESLTDISNVTIIPSKQRYVLHSDPRSSHQQIARIIRRFCINQTVDPILDVGASYGQLGYLLMMDYLTIDAVEPNKIWAQAAKRYYRFVFSSSIEEAPLQPNSYRMIVCADVLEHIADPISVIDELRKSATHNAVFIISLPNVAHIIGRFLLLIGKFPQMDRGIFDRTHLHFYTRDSATELLQQAGLKVIEYYSTPVPLPQIYTQWSDKWWMSVAMMLQQFAIKVAPRLFSYQWIMVAQILSDGVKESDKTAISEKKLKEELKPVMHYGKWHIFIRAFVFLLLILSLLPAWFSWRQITAYSSIPVRKVQLEHEFRLNVTNSPPIISGQGIGISTNGKIYVADAGTRRVLRFSNGSEQNGVVIGQESGPENIREPLGVAVKPDGTAYVIDRASGEVSIFNEQQGFIKKEKLGSPGAMVINTDLKGNLYIGDTGAHTVRKYLSNGDIDTSFGDNTTPGVARVGLVLGLAITEKNIFVVSEKALVKLDLRGKEIGRNPLPGNTGNLFAYKNKLYITDAPTNRVWVFDENGKVTERIETETTSNSFAQPRGIALDSEGRIYIMNENRVSVYRVL